MLLTVLIVVAASSVHGSGVVPVAPVAAPIVTSASSQYFERTFNRLVIAPPVFEPVIPVAAAPPVFVEPVHKQVPVVSVNPTQNVPIEPSVAIAVATAHAAAPVATILLPPYPFGPPPTIGFVPPVPPINVPDESRKESTTQTPSDENSTVRETEQTTPLPLPSNNANSFAQAPSNQNVNFKYGPPQPFPLDPGRPQKLQSNYPLQQMRYQKLRTSVEIVPVPLAYIAPPPLVHKNVKPIKIVHTFVPTRAKLIIRPINVRTGRVPARLVAYRTPISRKSFVRNSQKVFQGPSPRDIEPTTFGPFNNPVTKPPRL